MSGKQTLSLEEIVTGLYRVLLGREPELEGFSYWVERLQANATIEEFCSGIVRSNEYMQRPISVAGPNDLLCTWQTFPSNTAAFMMLPVHTNDPIVQSYLTGDRPNTYMLDLLAETTVIGDQVLDLGCHVGTFSIGAAAMGRRVIAVDASAIHIRLVKLSKTVNQFENFRLCHAAISSQIGVVHFVENGLFGAVDYSAEDPNAVEVKARSVDDIISDEFCPPVRFIKMDIEGAEGDALLTGNRVLTEDQPVVFFESSGTTLLKSGLSVVGLRERFEALGYKVFRVEGERWIYSPPEQAQPEDWVDMLALCDGDQRKWAERIDWKWEPGAMLEKFRQWAALPYPNTRRQLLMEIRRCDFDPRIRPEVEEIGRSLEQLEI